MLHDSNIKQLKFIVDLKYGYFKACFKRTEERLTGFKKCDQISELDAEAYNDLGKRFQEVVYEDDNGEWQTKDVAEIGDPSKVPLPVDISITSDDRRANRAAVFAAGARAPPVLAEA